MKEISITSFRSLKIGQAENAAAGTGATVGKLHGMEHCMKAGIGSYAVQVGNLQVSAVVAVNAVGDIYDYETGKKVAGLLAVRIMAKAILCAVQSAESAYGFPAANTL